MLRLSRASQAGWGWGEGVGFQARGPKAALRPPLFELEIRLPVRAGLLRGPLGPGQPIRGWPWASLRSRVTGWHHWCPRPVNIYLPSKWQQVVLGAGRDQSPVKAPGLQHRGQRLAQANLLVLCAWPSISVPGCPSGL